MPIYEIRFSAARERRGLPAWAVFEIIDAGYSRGVSSHTSKAEAQASLVALQQKG